MCSWRRYPGSYFLVVRDWVEKRTESSLLPGWEGEEVSFTTALFFSFCCHTPSHSPGWEALWSHIPHFRYASTAEVLQELLSVLYSGCHVPSMGRLRGVNSCFHHGAVYKEYKVQWQTDIKGGSLPSLLFLAAAEHAPTTHLPLPIFWNLEQESASNHSLIT